MTLGGDSGCYTTSQLNQAAILLVSRNADIELMPRIHRNWSAVECFKWTDASAIGDVPDAFRMKHPQTCRAHFVLCSIPCQWKCQIPMGLPPHHPNKLTNASATNFCRLKPLRVEVPASRQKPGVHSHCQIQNLKVHTNKDKYKGKDEDRDEGEGVDVDMGEDKMQVDCSPTPVSDTQGPRSLPVALALNAAALLTENYDDDDADDDYPMLVLDSDMDSEDEYDSETGSAHEFMVSNQELADILPSRTIAKKSAKNAQVPLHRSAAIATTKTIAARNKKKAGAQREVHQDRNVVKTDKQVPGTAKTHQVMVEDVENEDMDIMTAEPEPVRSAMTDRPRKNPIFHFFETVNADSNEQNGGSGALIAHLKSQSPLMYMLYEKFKDNILKKQPPSVEELRLAANLPPIDQHECKMIVANLKVTSLGVSIADSSGPDPAVMVR
ncbi:hypothetical protein V8E52_010294 [Russula decolorans]